MEYTVILHCTRKVHKQDGTLWCVWNCKLSFGYLESFFSSQLANSLLASTACLALSHLPCKSASLKPVYLKPT